METATNLHNTFVENIRVLCNLQGRKPLEIGGDVIGKSQMQNILRGWSFTSLKGMAQIANTLGVTVSYLFATHTEEEDGKHNTLNAGTGGAHTI